MLELLELIGEDAAERASRSEIKAAQLILVAEELRS
jgi:hypothetical protein